MLVDDPQLWLGGYDTFETFTAKPLTAQILDPSLFATTDPMGTFAPNHTPFVEGPKTLSISPAMLDKSQTAQEEVVWYSGAGKQVGGKKPPRGEGKGKGKFLGSRPNTMAEKAKALVDKGEKILGKRYEMSITTGLETVKRIKLVFHEDLTKEANVTPETKATTEANVTTEEKVTTEASPILDSPLSTLATEALTRRKPPATQSPRTKTPRPSTSPTKTEPTKTPQTKSTPTNAKGNKWLEERVTPEAAKTPGRPIPNAKDLQLDENTPPSSPIPVSPVRIVAEVVVRQKRVDRDLYPVFLGKDAKQTMVRSKIDGRVKGISYNW